MEPDELLSIVGDDLLSDCPSHCFHCGGSEREAVRTFHNTFIEHPMRPSTREYLATRAEQHFVCASCSQPWGEPPTVKCRLSMGDPHYGPWATGNHPNDCMGGCRGTGRIHAPTCRCPGCGEEPTMPPDKTWLDALDEAERKMTRAPWYVSHKPAPQNQGDVRVYLTERQSHGYVARMWAGRSKEFQNAEAIALSRNHLRSLIETARAAVEGSDIALQRALRSANLLPGDEDDGS